MSSCQVIELELCLGGITQLKQTTDLLGATEELNDDETTSDWEVKKSRCQQRIMMSIDFFGGGVVS